MISLTSMCNLKKSPKTKATELIDTENRWLWPGAEDGGGMGEMGENFKKKTCKKESKGNFQVDIRTVNMKEISKPYVSD